MSSAEFNLLGPLEVRANGREIPITGFTRRAALGFLLLNPNRIVSIGELTEALWAEEHPPTARGILLNVVSALRKSLHSGPAELLTQKPGYLLRVEPDLIDLHRFRTLAAAARACPYPSDVASKLREALALWRGPALADLVADGVAWPALAEVENARGVVLEDCIDAELSCGRHREVLPELERLVHAQPLRERLRGQLMLALYRSGRQADALTAYRSGREHIIEELGIEPGLELRELEQAILAHDPALRPPRAEAPAFVERKRVSVLAARLTVTPSTVDLDEALEAAVDRVRADVERFGGVVTGVLGSTVCAAFGAPRNREDDAARAVAAANAIVGSGVRAAVATGTALVSGSGELTGHLLDDCLGLVGSAGDGEVVVCDVTRRACGTDGRPTGPFIGRAAELDRLRSAFDEVCDGRRSRLITVLGMPGVGKSRLVAEFAEGVRCLVGRTPPFGRDAALAALAEIVRAHAGVLDSDSPDDAEKKLADAIDDPWVLSRLSTLAGAPGGRGDVLAAWRAFVADIAADEPLAVIIEDLHWADEELLDFVHGLADVAAPLLVVVTARPELLERRPGWGATLTLGPLDPDDSARLLRALLERHGVVGDVPLELTGGNPLFTEEYVRMLRDRGPVDGPLPDTVQTVIAARLDTLPPLEKAVLLDASVLGRTVWPGAVAAVGERSLDSVESALEHLRHKEFLRRGPSSVAGETEYTFTHVLVRDVAYDQIPQGHKPMKHFHAAVWVRALPLEHAQLLGHHFRSAVLLAEAAGRPCAELGRQARAALTEAGDKASALAAHSTAVRCYAAALDVCPPGHADRPHLLLRHGVSLSWGGTGEEVLRSAAQELLAIGDHAAAAEAELALWRLTGVALFDLREWPR